ncbi:pilus assembly protein PilZ [Methylocystis echinoides]|uniref:Pilus assembly protein PilZ n=1 Tax=Methylocystis echinoides TaxID=29468 RepID=A0A9W6LU02_9HYPH|nr:pilus assembly protein PilZ [Methylocystis echinoides]
MVNIGSGMSADNSTQVQSARVRLSLEGRYMLVGSTDEHTCTAIEMSPADVALRAPVSAPPGAKVVLYLKQLGRFAGPILRTTDFGFEMQLELTPQRSDKLATQLAWLADRQAHASDKRNGDRIVPLTDITILRLPRGRECVARVRSFSHAGAEILTDHPIAVGEEIVIGRTPARVVRLASDGVGCEFLRHFQPGELDETTRL